MVGKGLAEGLSIRTCRHRRVGLRGGRRQVRQRVQRPGGVGRGSGRGVHRPFEGSCGTRLRHLGVEQGRALALGEAILAAVAVEQPDMVLLAVAGADGEVAGAPMAVEGHSGFWQQKRTSSSMGSGRPVGGRVAVPEMRGEGLLTTPIPHVVFNSSGTLPLPRDKARTGTQTNLLRCGRPQLLLHLGPMPLPIDAYAPDGSPSPAIGARRAGRPGQSHAGGQRQRPGIRPAGRADVRCAPGGGWCPRAPRGRIDGNGPILPADAQVVGAAGSHASPAGPRALGETLADPGGGFGPHSEHRPMGCWGGPTAGWSGSS
jgi:hypothetical protein